MQFYVVYIREAHAIDSYLPKGGGADPIVEDPTTLEERREVGELCLARLALEEIPALIDGLDDRASRAYDAWPDRLALIGLDGRVAYFSTPGPVGFLPDELEAAIVAERAKD